MSELSIETSFRKSKFQSLWENDKVESGEESFFWNSLSNTGLSDLRIQGWNNCFPSLKSSSIDVFFFGSNFDGTKNQTCGLWETWVRISSSINIDSKFEILYFSEIWFCDQNKWTFDRIILYKWKILVEKLKEEIKLLVMETEEFEQRCESSLKTIEALSDQLDSNAKKNKKKSSMIRSLLIK